MAGITTRELQALTLADDGRRLADGQGVFGIVRVGAKGISVQFSLRYRSAGAVREIRLGTFPKSSLRQIRDARDGARAQINGREDPLEHKRIERLKKRAQIDVEVRSLEDKLARRTFRQRFNEWVDSALQKRTDKGKEIRRAFEKDTQESHSQAKRATRAAPMHNVASQHKPRSVQWALRSPTAERFVLSRTSKTMTGVAVEPFNTAAQ